MLALLLSWILIIIISISFGLMSMKFLSFIWKQSIIAKEVAIDHLLLLGFAIVTIIASYLSLILPVNSWLTGLFLLIALGYICRNQTEFNEIKTKVKNSWYQLNTPLKFLVGLLLSAILISAASPITHYDFGLFQLQYLKWIQNYPVIPGLGNLDHRFSFNSHYFISSALFSFIVSEEQVVCSLNSFFWALLTFRIILNINDAYKKNVGTQLIFYQLLLAAFIYFMLTQLSGLSTDILNNVLVCYTLISLLQLDESGKKEQPILWIIPIIVCLTITFKLSSALLIISLLYLLFRVKTWQYFFYLGTCGLIICIPFLARNIILSGYLIFPFPPIDLFSVDWKVPMEVVVGEIANVKGWARIPYTKEASTYPISEWIGIWFTNKGIALKLILVINAFLIVPIIYLFKQKQFLQASILSICLANLTFWFLQAPFPRYVHSFLFFGFALTLSLLATPILSSLKVPLRTLYIGGVLFIISTLLISGSSFVKRDISPSILWLGKNCQKMEVEDYETTSGLIINYPKGKDKRCFNATLPCTHHPERSLSLRNENIANGFKSIPQ